MLPAKKPVVSKAGLGNAVRPKIVQVPENKLTDQRKGSLTEKKILEKDVPPAGLRRLPAKPAKKNADEEEKSDEKPRLGPYTEKPSARFTSIKTVDVFSSKPAQKTNSFAYVYNAGGIPVKIDHGSVHNKIKWDEGTEIKELNYDPILVTCFEGLMEPKHPYNFIAKAVIKDMLNTPGAPEKVVPILNKVVWPLRTALLSKSDPIFDSALDTLKNLAQCVGPHLNPHVKNLLTPIIKHAENKNYKVRVFEILRIIEENGGPDIVKIIKSAFPTYSNM